MTAIEPESFSIKVTLIAQLQITKGET